MLRTVAQNVQPKFIHVKERLWETLVTATHIIETSTKRK